MTMAEMNDGRDQGSATLVRIELEDHPVEFTGTLVHRVSTRSPGQSQWTELALYRVTGNARSRYAVVNSGMSVLYHVYREDGLGCNAGVRKVLGRLSDEAYDILVPCSACRPRDLDDLPDDAVIAVEIPRNGITTARDAADLIHRMRQPPAPGTAGRRRAVSALGTRLLQEAREWDDDIDTELRRPRGLDDEDDVAGDGPATARGKGVA